MYLTKRRGKNFIVFPWIKYMRSLADMGAKYYVFRIKTLKFLMKNLELYIKSLPLHKTSDFFVSIC